MFGTDAGFAAEIELSSLLSSNGGDGSVGFVLQGTRDNDKAGYSVSTAGDVNGDGIDDLVIGAPYADPVIWSDRGKTYVLFGRNDTDGDEIADLFDNCPAVANPDQGDADADQIGDACDNCIDAANTDQRDTNADGFGNVCDADLSNDCQVNYAELMVMKNVFVGSDRDADRDGSGVVNFGDLSIMKANFFGVPGPSGLPNICD